MIKTHEKIKLVGMAMALMAVMSMAGTGWAKKNSGGGGSGVGQGTFTNATRTEVSVSVTVPAYAGCSAAVSPATAEYEVKAYIFQPSGRMFAIGISEPTGFICSATLETSVPVTIKAFPGLDFKPGPATLLFKVISITDADGAGTVSAPVETVIYEYGSRVDLH